MKIAPNKMKHNIMKVYKLLSPAKLGKIELDNRVVMAPMTRSRALQNIPNALMAHYYAQRAGAGLIITEGTSPSPNGLGYARIPGIFNEEQTEGWKLTTQAVHDKGGKIFVQLMHTGRVSHMLNMPEEAKIMAPSAVQAKGQMWTDAKQMQDFPVPVAMTQEEIQTTKQEYVDAAKNAIAAGFDGVELHGANGYLMEQFLSPASNKRTDEYGGTVENRCRFIIEVVAAASDAIGKDRIGIRLSPFGVANDMPNYPGISEVYDHLSNELNRLGILYIHLADHSAMGAPVVPLSIKLQVRNNFKNSLILSGGYDLEHAENDVHSNFAELVAFGRPFIDNPDLVERFRHNWPISTEPDASLFYSAGEKGYSDYPVYSMSDEHELA